MTISGYLELLSLDLLALVWFLICFNGYASYARKASYKEPCLASVMHLYRTEWMKEMLLRDVRVADTTTVANLERGVTFFASTTMLILAGLMTLITRGETAMGLLASVPGAEMLSSLQWDIRILAMMVLFVYAFFKFTWSLRQYGFVSVMIGGAPLLTEDRTREIDAHASRIAKMASMAANNFNTGLRSYYFAIAMLGWLIHSALFIALALAVVWILYRREFTSSTLKTLGHTEDFQR
jgi:uncharacterized membrane protein